MTLSTLGATTGALTVDVGHELAERDILLETWVPDNHLAVEDDSVAGPAVRASLVEAINEVCLPSALFTCVNEEVVDELRDRARRRISAIARVLVPIAR